MSANHTPTPWRVDPVSQLDINGPEDYGDVAVCLAREMSDLVIKAGTVGPSLRTQAQANAAYIVECVNNYATLQREVEELREKLRLCVDLASQEWQESDGKRRGATDNAGKRLWFISDEVMQELRSTLTPRSAT